MTPEGGRRHADDRRDEELSAALASTPGPPSDGAMTMPRTSRADRRREGLLPSGEDPMLRRPPPRPAGSLPPGGGRRRTDADPTAAPGRPPATGERRRPVVPAPEPIPQVQPPSAPARPPIAPAARRSAVPRPAPSPADSSPMTAAAPMSAAAPMTPAAPMTAAAPMAGRVLPPAGRPDRSSPSGATAVGPDGAPQTTGMPSWAAEPAAPPLQDVTQRVSGIAPADSAWGGQVAAAPVEAAPAPQTPSRPLRSRPPWTPPAAPAPMLAEHPEPETVDESAPVRRRVDIPVGGRAAARLERQAAEAARKKTGRRSGPPSSPESPAQRGPATAGPGRDTEPTTAARRLPHRLVQGLVAVVLVAVGVLGFWSFTSPNAEETAAQSPAPTTAAVGALPAQESIAPSAEVIPPPVGPVRAPVTVLNSTNVTGLASNIGAQLTRGGWQVTGTAQSPVKDVATTTVYYTEGDTVQQQAAAQLIGQFPDVSGPVPRYFDVPGQPAPGLVVVATGNWRP